MPTAKSTRKKVCVVFYCTLHCIGIGKENIWGKVITKADEITVKVELSKERTKKLKERVDRCSQNLKEAMKSSKSGESQIANTQADLYLTDPKFFNGIEFLRLKSKEKWNAWAKNVDSYARKHECLNSIKPCCTYSFYGAMLKWVYGTKDLEAVRGLWYGFLKLLHSELESDQQFK